MSDPITRKECQENTGQLCKVFTDGIEKISDKIDKNDEKRDGQHVTLCERLTAVETKVDERTGKGVVGHGITGAITTAFIAVALYFKDKVGL